MYKMNEAAALRNKINAAISVALEDAAQHPLIIKVISSSITHTDLQPDGDMFTIQLVVETHEKKEVPTE